MATIDLIMMITTIWIAAKRRSFRTEEDGDGRENFLLLSSWCHQQVLFRDEKSYFGNTMWRTTVTWLLLHNRRGFHPFVHHLSSLDLYCSLIQQHSFRGWWWNVLFLKRCYCLMMYHQEWSSSFRRGEIANHPKGLNKKPTNVSSFFSDISIYFFIPSFDHPLHLFPLLFIPCDLMANHFWSIMSWCDAVVDLHQKQHLEVIVIRIIIWWPTDWWTQEYRIMIMMISIFRLIFNHSLRSFIIACRLPATAQDLSVHKPVSWDRMMGYDHLNPVIFILIPCDAMMTTS